MAKKSKTQRAKASARRAEKRDAAEEVVRLAENGESTTEESSSTAKAKKATTKESVLSKSTEKKPAKEPGRIVTFLKGVRSEMRRVTWPTRTDVIRWSGVVVGALLFFGVFVFILDNIFPQLLVLLDSANSTGA